MTPALESLLATVPANPITRQLEWHNDAVRAPRGFEVGILALYTGLYDYARAYRRTYDGPIGEDGYGSECFACMVSGFTALLNMDLGRLDGGTLSDAINRLCVEHGIGDSAQ